MNIFGECEFTPKPVAVAARSQLHQQWPSDSYSMGDDEDELFKMELEHISISEMESDQWSLYSEGISYRETSSAYNNNSYNNLDDQQTLETCTLGHNELVIPKLHNWSLPSDSDHATVCRYCREEVKNCYYDHHLVRCMEHWKQYGCDFKNAKTYSHDQACKHSSVEETRHFNGCTFTVNCTAVQETTSYSYF